MKKMKKMKNKKVARGRAQFCKLASAGEQYQWLARVTTYLKTLEYCQKFSAKMQ